MIALRVTSLASKHLHLLQTQDVDATISRRDSARLELREKFSPELLLEGFRTFFPNPVRSRHTAITFSPRRPPFQWLMAWLEADPTSALLSGGAIAAAVVVGALYLFKWVRRR